jgi:plastocyanin
MVTQFLDLVLTSNRAASLGKFIFLALLPLSFFCPQWARATTVTVMVGEDGFSFSPSAVTIQPGDTVQWIWSASGHSSTSGNPGSPSGFWDSGIRSQGATFSHTFNSVGSFPYYCTPHGACCGMRGTVTVSSPTPTPSPSTVQALNISTRMQVDTANNVLIAGFILTGTGSDNVILRGIGPSLSGAGVSGALADPTLELHDSGGGVLMQNDNWQDDSAQAAQLTAAGLAPQNSNESGIAAALQPSSYTAILAGKNQTTGVGLVEVYDIGQGGGMAQLANISTRGLVLTGNNVMIGGFILAGSGSAHVAIRGLGPSLGQVGSQVLSDPTLELHDSNGTLLVANDNWQDDPTSAGQLTALGLGPTNALESAISTSLPPGAFTAIVAGKAGATGVALVEVYNVP